MIPDMAILPIDGGRYGTDKMKEIFDDQKKITYQLEIEAAVALSQAEIGMVPRDAAANISKMARSGKITVKRVKQLESKSDHDTAALVEALSELCKPSAKPWIHYGLTSNDLVDTSNSLQIRDTLRIIEPKVARLALILSEQAVKYKALPAVGRTHGQHASIISFGLKFANWALEMSTHVQRIEELKKRVLICKTLGVVGTGSLMGAKALEVQKRVAKKLELYPADVTTQVVARERYAELVFYMALIGSTLEKIAVEIRNLQRTEIGEVAESFKKGQMGSSAVPVKRNPVKSERVTSLSKLLRSQISVAFENIPLWHERDLTNSANERFIIPTGAILLDEMLETMTRIVGSLFVNQDRIRQNLEITRGQIFAEFVLDAMIQKGVPRFEAYRDIQRVAFASSEDGTDFRDAVRNDKAFSSHLTDQEIDEIFVPENHLGASFDIIKNVSTKIRGLCSKFS
ncbi:Adenylosuccinate lyase [Nitrosotalea sinensis]|uniref:Adenylosuccinate lyase n=2 Tax=Nitrosotalea sinensis TaxID=1499975 RepID=A0A2H1EG02_9ARCH|nr:Adenylosuccinate lyase [Candidatus Nitrosotalea sinensis]